MSGSGCSVEEDVAWREGRTACAERILAAEGDLVVSDPDAIVPQAFDQAVDEAVEGEAVRRRILTSTNALRVPRGDDLLSRPPRHWCFSPKIGNALGSWSGRPFHRGASSSTLGPPGVTWH